MVVTQSSSRYAGSNWGKCRCRSIAQRWHQSARDLDARRSSPRQYRAESQPHRAPPSRSQKSMGRMVAGRLRRECAACSMSQPPRTLTALVVLLHLKQAHRQSRSPSQRAGRAQRPPASVIYSVAPTRGGVQSGICATPHLGTKLASVMPEAGHTSVHMMCPGTAGYGDVFFL
ncbi:hypothetical protein T492DRAFT_445014 [Pavlovales sp. CCMP2436]|nr:hypothetical protein T492DRAFT_445014 [Pavlovales sp. CCMP2436]